MEEAPMPKVTTVAAITLASTPKAYFKRISHTERSRSPRPTTVKPITLPAEKATRRPLLSPSVQAFAVRALDAVAIFIPIKPESPEYMPPVKNANGIYGFFRTLNSVNVSRMANTTRKKTVTTAYCRFRNADAPSRTAFEIFFIKSVPSSNFKTRLAVRIT